MPVPTRVAAMAGLALASVIRFVSVRHIQTPPPRTGNPQRPMPPEQDRSV